MIPQKYDLLNVERQISEPAWKLTSENGPKLTGADFWSVELKRMKGGLSEGIDVVTMNNGVLEIDILPTRGMGIWKGVCQGLRLGWDSPVALPVHPGFVNLESRGQLGWLDGFNEWICRCGLASSGPPGPDEDGTPLTLHGKIANLAAHKVSLIIDEETQSLSLVGVVDETSMFGTNLRLTSTVTLVAGQPTILIEDVISNRSSSEQEYELLYHINQGTPFLSPKSSLHVPFREMAPRDERAAEGLDQWDRYQPAETGFSEQVYYFKPESDSQGWGQAILKNPEQKTGIQVRFQTETLPYLAIWKNTQHPDDGYVTGVEPCTDFPNHRSVERRSGRLKTIRAGESTTHRLELRIARNEEELQQLETLIERQHVDSESIIHSMPSF